MQSEVVLKSNAILFQMEVTILVYICYTIYGYIARQFFVQIKELVSPDPH